MPTKSRALPPIEELRSAFRYDKESGAIYPIRLRTTRKSSDVRCDPVRKIGYRVVCLGERLLYAHRLAWCLAYGSEPNGYVDHINGDRADNRLVNLRIGTHPQNMCNRRVATHSKSGIRGLHQRENGKWRAYCGFRGKRFNIGTFASQEEAIVALRAARHIHHGIFARDD